MKTSLSNQERIYCSLLENIRKKVYPAGELLPSLRELAKVYFSTPGTVRQALMKLQNDGIVTAHHGCGYRVNKQEVRSKNILILEQTGNPHLYGNFLNELCACIHEYPEYTIHLEDTLRYKVCPEKLYQRLLPIAGNYEAIFFNGEDVMLSREAFIELQKHTQLYYYFNSKTRFSMTGIPGVSTNWDHGQYIGIRHLIDCGCKRIFVLSGTVRHDGALAALKDTGTDAELVFIQRKEVFYQKIETEMFDGLYCSQDPIAVEAVHRLRKRGIQIPGEIAVVGYYNTPWSEHPETPLTSVCINEHSMIRRVFDMFTGKLAKAQLFELPTLVIRASTKDFKKNNNREI